MVFTDSGSTMLQEDPLNINMEDFGNVSSIFGNFSGLEVISLSYFKPIHMIFLYLRRVNHTWHLPSFLASSSRFGVAFFAHTEVDELVNTLEYGLLEELFGGKQESLNRTNYTMEPVDDYLTFNNDIFQQSIANIIEGK